MASPWPEHSWLHVEYHEEPDDGWWRAGLEKIEKTAWIDGQLRAYEFWKEFSGLMPQKSAMAYGTKGNEVVVVEYVDCGVW